MRRRWHGRWRPRCSALPCLAVLMALALLQHHPSRQSSTCSPTSSLRSPSRSRSRVQCSRPSRIGWSRRSLASRAQCAAAGRCGTACCRCWHSFQLIADQNQNQNQIPRLEPLVITLLASRSVYTSGFPAHGCSSANSYGASAGYFCLRASTASGIIRLRWSASTQPSAQ